MTLHAAIDGASDEELRAALKATATTVMQLTITLLVVGGFAMSVVGAPDILLLLPEAQLDVPSLGGMPPRVALVMGPAALIGVWGLLRVYLTHWRRLNRVARARGLARTVEVSPFRDGALRVGATAIRYGLMPAALFTVAWKGLAFPNTFGMPLLVLALAMTIISLAQDLPLNRWIWALVLPALAGAAGAALWASLTITLSESTLYGDVTFAETLRRPMALRYAALARRDLYRRDLTRARLDHAELMTSDLERATLTDANLRSANLTDANLWSATLTRADLFGATLTDATLRSANLTGADLRSANLTDAELWGANLTRATLWRANLTGARLAWERGNGDIRARADLRGARNLTCDQLTSAKLWQHTHRDPELACGADIPDPPSQ